MQKAIKYTIFRTGWGYFGLAGTENWLLRTHLPCPDHEKIKSQLLKNLSRLNPESSIEFDKTLFKTLQEQIIAYFEGGCVNFSRDIPIVLDGFSSFVSSVLTACRDIRFGQTITYGQLAKKLGRPAASRAVANALAKNPLPLIIPCHRVIRSPRRFASQSAVAGGKLVPAQAGIGGFSVPGGITLKKKLLLHEKKALQ